jgi:hypothetical protein
MYLYHDTEFTKLLATSPFNACSLTLHATFCRTGTLESCYTTFIKFNSDGILLRASRRQLNNYLLDSINPAMELKAIRMTKNWLLTSRSKMRMFLLKTADDSIKAADREKL